MGPPHARTPQNKSRAESSVTTHEADVCLQKWVGGVGVGVGGENGDTRDERDS